MSLPRMSKKEFEKVTDSIEKDSFFKGKAKWGKKSQVPLKSKEATSLEPATVVDRLKREFIELSLSDIDEGEQIVPPDIGGIAVQKTSMSLGGESPSITVRLCDNRYHLLDGHAVVSALRELGRDRVQAVAVSGLSDLDAEIWRLSGCVRSKLPVLDKAIVYKHLAEAMKEKVSQLATPLGGKQPREIYVRKLAKALKLSKDQAQRAIKIGGIKAEAQREIRKEKLQNNQAALIEIASSSEDSGEQIVALRALVKRRLEKLESTRKRRLAPKVNHPWGDQTVVIREEHTRNISFDEVQQEWMASRLYSLLAQSSFGIRQRFCDECAAPLVDPSLECVAK